MRYNTIAIAFALSAVGLADKLEFEDVPRNCMDICTPVVNLTTGCDDRGPSKSSSLNHLDHVSCHTNLYLRRQRLR